MSGEQDRLTAALDRLPTLARIVYLLSAADGLSYAAISFRLGRPVEEVKGHLSDALYLLSGMMKGEWPDP